MNALSFSSLAEHPAVTRLGLTLAHFLWQGAMLAVLAVIARRLSHAAPAPARRGVAVAFLTMAALCPFVTFCALPSPPEAEAARPGRNAEAASGTFSAPEIFPLPPSEPLDAPAPVLMEKTIPPPSAPVPEEAENSAAGSPSPSSVSAWARPLNVLLPGMVLIWACGVILLALRHAGGWWLLRRWRRRATPAPEAWRSKIAELAERLEMRRAACLAVSLRNCGPALAGILRPVILVPAAAFTGMNPAHLEAILLHELAHLKQRDQWVTALLIFTETLLFYHPAVWLLGGWVREERENAADERAAAVCGGRMEYARALAGLAGFQAAPAPALAADGGSLAARIRRLTGGGRAKPGSLSGGLLPALAAAGGALFLAFSSGAQTRNAPAPETAEAENAAPSAISPAPGQALQLLVDAAAEGAVIQLGEGIFEEDLVLTKPVTLEGAGEAKTFLKRKSPEAGPVVTLRDVKNVTLRGLRVVATPVESDGNTLGAACAVEAENATFVLENCSITGPYHNGIVMNASSAEIRGCLVSGMWSNGITVGRGCQDVLISGTDVRNCYYTPIVIGRRTERVKIDRCRVSGGAWHGIRYDDASPEITNCLIFQNARCGIYASGRTKAVIRGNVFLANEMSGVSCWFANEDVIENNTFYGNLRESIGVLGGSKPLIRRNIIADSPVAISLGKIGGEKDGGGDPAPVVEENLLWNNAKERSRLGKDEQLTDAEKPVRADPLFVDAKARDFRPTENSQAKKLDLGAREPLAFASPWPLTEGEKRIIPDGESRDSTLWKTAGYKERQERAVIEKQQRRAREKAEEWKREALQIDSVERRDAAVAAMRAAIESSDPEEALPGLIALGSSVAAEFDKAVFRAPARKWMVSGNAALRNAALGALVRIGAEAADLEALYTLAENRETPDRAGLVSYLHWIGKGDLTGRGGKVALEMLGDEDPRQQRDVLNALWGARFSEELEARVIELSRREDWQKAHDAIYYALSPQANKSARSVDRLLEVMAREGDPNNTQRAFWGLGQGVSKEHAPHLARSAARIFGENVSPEFRGWCLDLIKTYGGREELPFLEQTAARPAVTSTIRKAVEEAKAAIAARGGEHGHTASEP